MPAPKGNKFAAKTNPKSKRFECRLKPADFKKLEKIAKNANLTKSEVVEKLILTEYKKILDK